MARLPRKYVVEGATRRATRTGIVVVPRAWVARRGRNRLKRLRAVGQRVVDVDREGLRGRVAVAIGSSEGDFVQAVQRRGIPQCLSMPCSLSPVLVRLLD